MSLEMSEEIRGGEQLEGWARLLSAANLSEVGHLAAQQGKEGGPFFLLLRKYISAATALGKLF